MRNYGVVICSKKIPADIDAGILFNDRGRPGTYERFWFSDVLRGHTSPAKFSASWWHGEPCLHIGCQNMDVVQYHVEGGDQQ